LGLGAAIREWLAEEIEKKHGLAVVFEDDGSEKILDTDTSAFLFRAVRELLVNVVKHAQAKNIKVSLQKENKTLIVSVIDDGLGFRHSGKKSLKSKKGGYGLFSIRERLSYLGGSVDIKSVLDRGTGVVLRVPMIKKQKSTGE
jgi:signal transduction histidine kinase